MQTMTSPKQSKIKLLSTIVAVVVIAGIVLIADHLKAKNTSTTSAVSPSTSTTQPRETSTTTPSTNSTAVTSTSSAYKDGSYTASSDYYVPHGNENIEVAVTIKGGVITDSSITNSEGDHDSARYQEDFASVYKSYVVGKSINDLKLGIIAGASDTTDGFNDAIAQIANKAKA